jgi:uncharacterized surface protein with fasciclin (FAS1) repeats
VPSAEALRRLPPDSEHTFLRPENRDQLINLIEGHIIAEKVDLEDVSSIKVRTINGKDLYFQKNNDSLTVNGIRVIKTESIGTNGIIYVIDGILPR